MKADQTDLSEINNLDVNRLLQPERYGEEMTDEAVDHAEAGECDEQPATAKRRWKPAPMEDLPDLLQRFSEEVATSMSRDPSIAALATIVTIAGTLGRSVCIQLKSNWREFPSFWASIVADSGAAKSPVFSTVLEPVTELNKELIAGSQRAISVWESRVQRSSKTGDGETQTEREPRPRRRQLKISDVTTEALSETLVENPAGVFLAMDELSGWFGMMNCYRASKTGPDVPRWLQCWSGGAWEINRKGRTPECVKNAHVSVLGAIPPSILQGHLAGDHQENGLAARLLLVRPPSSPAFWTEEVLSQEVKEQFADLIKRCNDLRETCNVAGGEPVRVLRLQRAARKLFVEFHDEAARNADEIKGLAGAVWAKAKGHLARLALLFCVSRQLGEGEELVNDHVEEGDMRKAVSWMRWLVEETLRNLAPNQEIQHVVDLDAVKSLIQENGGRISVAGLRGRSRAYRGKGVASKILEDLKARGVGEWVYDPAPEGGGRNRKQFVLLSCAGDEN